MLADIDEQTGTPQSQVDWSDPDVWIPQRLQGSSAALARRIWTESGNEVNPRHTNGIYLFVNNYSLLEENQAGVHQVTPRGRRFLDQDEEIVREIDDAEGIGELLSILATKLRAMRADLLPDWSEFLREHSRFGSLSTFKHTLHRRLVNLVERGLVTRDGNAYLITPAGSAHAAALGRHAGGGDPRASVTRVVAEYNQAQRDALRERLGTMHPFRFEQLVGDLLGAMGYEDVQVTRQSGDRGIDVVATVQFGITTIVEVVQVKRHRAAIGRPVLDQLRGALPYHKAIRGTLITLGSFSSGCKEAALFPGAAPITLIDGDRLLDLLVKNEVGVQMRTVKLTELDEAYFHSGTEEDEIRVTMREEVAP
jgi:restriction system protein